MRSRLREKSLGKRRAVGSLLKWIFPCRPAQTASSESEAGFRLLCDLSPVGLFQADSQGRWTYVNGYLAGLIGTSAERCLGDRWMERLHPEDRDRAFIEWMKACRAGKDLSCEFRVSNTGGDARRLRIQAKARRTDEGGLAGYVGSVEELASSNASLHKEAKVHSETDATRRNRALQRLRAQLAVVRVLAEANTLAEATPKLLEAICESLGWDLGIFWVVDESAGVLQHEQTWHAPDMNIRAFEAATLQRTFNRGVGNPGRAWESGQPVWEPDLARDKGCPRVAGAEKDGIHAGFAFPLKCGDKVLGVMEVFSSRVQEPDEEILQMLTVIGTQVGQFMERKQMRDRLQLQSTALEAAANGVVITDRNGIIQWTNQALTRLTGYSSDEMIGQSTRLFRSGHHPISRYQTMWQTILAGKVKSSTGARTGVCMMRT
jgi:PAS domain S-box-containing protein